MEYEKCSYCMSWTGSELQMKHLVSVFLGHGILENWSFWSSKFRKSSPKFSLLLYFRVCFLHFKKFRHNFLLESLTPFLGVKTCGLRSSHSFYYAFIPFTSLWSILLVMKVSILLNYENLNWEQYLTKSILVVEWFFSMNILIWN